MTEFANELSWVKDPDFRDLVLRMVEEYEQKMAEVPSSTHGHHPEDERKAGGIILHCKRVAWLCFELCREHNLPENVLDAMIGASILHDIGRIVPWSFGKEPLSYYKTRHGSMTVTMLSIKHRKEIAKTHTDTKQRVKIMYGLIETHMSHWDPSSPQPSNVLQFAFCTADYLASRNELRVPTLAMKEWCQ